MAPEGQAVTGTFKARHGAGGPGRAGLGARPARGSPGETPRGGSFCARTECAPLLQHTAGLGFAFGTGRSLGVVQPLQ